MHMYLSVFFCFLIFLSFVRSSLFAVLSFSSSTLLPSPTPSLKVSLGCPPRTCIDVGFFSITTTMICVIGACNGARTHKKAKHRALLSFTLVPSPRRVCVCVLLLR
jgi:hypothetical protein